MRRAVMGVLLAAFLFAGVRAEATNWTKTAGSDGSFPLFPDAIYYKVQTLGPETFVAIGRRQDAFFDINFQYVFKSTDGGATIVPIYDGANYASGMMCRSLIRINDLQFVDQNNGVLFGGWGGENCGGFFSTVHNYIAVTNDGGGAWDALALLPDESNNQIYGAGFYDRTHAFAAGWADNLWRTADPQADWDIMTSAYHDFDAVEYHSVSAPSATDIYAAGEFYLPEPWTDDDWQDGTEDDWGQKGYPELNATRGALIRSADGGHSWTYLYSTDDLPGPLQDNVGFHKVQFIGERGWLLAVNAPSRLVELLYSTDGGASWHESALPNTYVGGPGNGYVLADFQMLTAASGWAVGSSPQGNSVILTTSDSGATWAADDYTGYGPLLSIHMFGPRAGFATGSRGTVLRYVPPNRTPVADAGPDQDAYVDETVALDGTGSYDPDGDPLAYLWTQTLGAPALLTGADTATPSFVPTEIDDYVFSLVVSDGSLSSGPDYVRIHVIEPDDDAGDDAGDDAADDDASDDGDDDDTAPGGSGIDVNAHGGSGSSSGGCGC